jgi:hypothetical protein
LNFREGVPANMRALMHHLAAITRHETLAD